MDGLNYHHLLYFWKVARSGSIARASAELELTQPTISEQIRLLENSLGRKLFDRVGRSLVLTDTGRTVYSYAERIFQLGEEMTDALRGTETRPAVLRVAVDPSVDPLVVTTLLAPAMRSPERSVLEVNHIPQEQALPQLSDGKLQLVLSSRPAESKVANTHPHLLLECGIAFVSARTLPATAKPPRSFEGLSFLMPPPPLRDSLQHWFRKQKISPRLAGVFDSYDLLRSFAEQGIGAFAVPDLPTSVSGFKVLGRSDAVRSRFYAFTRESKPKDPLLAAITASRKRR